MLTVGHFSFLTQGSNSLFLFALANIKSAQNIKKKSEKKFKIANQYVKNIDQELARSKLNSAKKKTKKKHVKKLK